MNWRIRKLRAADCAATAALLAGAFADNPAYAFMHPRASNRGTAEAPSYWHVHAVAVEPKHQRGGAGTALLNHVFAELDLLHAARPAPVILSTQRESNLRLYSRYGFEQHGLVTIGAGKPGAFQSWRMRRR